MARIIGVDPGDKICGIALLDDNQIVEAANLSHADFWAKLSELLIAPKNIVVIEDIKPYSGKLSPQVIDTCKFIGEAVFRLSCVLGATGVILVPRSEIKKWSFDVCPSVAIPLIDKKIGKGIKKGKYLTKEGIARKASHVFVDDEIVKKIMKSLYSIPDPPPGKSYQFGLKDHSWQSLALCAWYEAKISTPCTYQPVLES